MEKDELVQLLKRLFDLNPENRSFLEAKLSPCGDHSMDYYKREIAAAVNPDMDSPIEMKRGRKAIASYKKAAPDDLWGRGELMVYFVEQGADFPLDYGDIDGPFYTSLCRMIDSILEVADQLSSKEYSHLAQRFEALDAATANKIGWGFSDHITDAKCVLLSRLEQ